MRSREDGSSSSPGARLSSVASLEEPFDNGCHRRTVREINECGRAHLGENERVAAAAALRKHHLKFTKTKVGGRAEEGEPSVWKLATVEEALRPLPPTASSLRATLQHWGAGVFLGMCGATDLQSPTTIVRVGRGRSTHLTSTMWCAFLCWRGVPPRPPGET